MVGKVSWRSKQCKWVVLNPVLNKVTQLREKLSKKCSRDTEFYIGGQKFSEVSGLVMKQRIGIVRKSMDRQLKSQDLKTFRDVVDEVHGAKIQPFNRRSKPPQEKEVLFATQNTGEFVDFQSLELVKLKDEDFYNLLNNDEETEEGQEQFRSQKRKIKEILSFGMPDEQPIRPSGSEGDKKRGVNCRNISQLIKVRTANLERVRKRINIKDMPDMWIQPFGEVEEPERCKTTRNLQSDQRPKTFGFFERKFTVQLKRGN